MSITTDSEIPLKDDKTDRIGEQDNSKTIDKPKIKSNLVAFFLFGM